MKTSILTTLGFAVAVASTSRADDTPPPTPPPTPPQAMTTPAEASAGSAGPYVGLDVGAIWLQSLSAGSGPLGVDFKFNTGWGLTVPIGYDFGNGFTLDFSVGYYESGISSVTGNAGGSSQPASTNGNETFVPLMANAAYKIHLADNFHFYIGAGLGAVYERNTFTAFDDPADQTISFGQLGGLTAAFGGLDSSQWSFGFQAFTGLAYDITPNASINVGYRFLHVNDNISVNGSSAGSFNGSSVELGVTFKF